MFCQCHSCSGFPGQTIRTNEGEGRTCCDMLFWFFKLVGSLALRWGWGEGEMCNDTAKKTVVYYSTTASKAWSGSRKQVEIWRFPDTARVARVLKTDSPPGPDCSGAMDTTGIFCGSSLLSTFCATLGFPPCKFLLLLWCGLYTTSRAWDALLVFWCVMLRRCLCSAGFTCIQCIQFLGPHSMPSPCPSKSESSEMAWHWPHRKHTTGRTIWQCTRLDHIVGALLGHCFLLRIAKQLFDQLPLFRRLLPPWLVDGPSLAFLL